MEIKHVLLAGILGISLFSCKKEEEVTNLLTSTTDSNLNGVIKGKVTGNTGDDSTAFSFSYSHIYEYEWNESYWNYSNNNLTKTDATSDQIDVWIERYADDDWSHYSWIEIDNWDYVDGDIADADIEIYIETYQRMGDKTLYYEQWLEGDDVEVNSISFDKDSGKFSITLTGTIQEGDNEGTTGNPGTITMSYSGELYSGDVIEKRSLR